MTNTEKRIFIEEQIKGLEKPIFENSILQKGYAAGGEVAKEQFDKTSATLGSLIAIRDALQAELEQIPA